MDKLEIVGRESVCIIEEEDALEKLFKKQIESMEKLADVLCKPIDSIQIPESKAADNLVIKFSDDNGNVLYQITWEEIKNLKNNNSTRRGNKWKK